MYIYIYIINIFPDTDQVDWYQVELPPVLDAIVIAGGDLGTHPGDCNAGSERIDSQQAERRTTQRSWRTFHGWWFGTFFNGKQLETYECISGWWFGT